MINKSHAVARPSDFVITRMIIDRIGLYSVFFFFFFFVPVLIFSRLTNHRREVFISALCCTTEQPSGDLKKSQVIMQYTRSKLTGFLIK